MSDAFIYVHPTMPDWMFPFVVFLTVVFFLKRVHDRELERDRTRDRQEADDE